jgi:hypothetical protein
MVSSGVLRRVVLVRTNVSEEPSASFIRVTRIGELPSISSQRHRLLVTASVVPSSPILVNLMEALGSSETSVLTRSTRCNIPEDTILHSHRRGNLKSYNNAFAAKFQNDEVNLCWLRSRTSTILRLRFYVFGNASPCGSCKNWRFGEKYRLNLQGESNQRTKTG